MPKRAGKKKESAQALVETGLVEAREPNLLTVAADDWTVVLEWQGRGKAAGCVERADGFVLVHFDLPVGPLGEYHISVQQPFVDIHRSWAGVVDCWRGTELASVALNYSFETAANHSLPVVCNYDHAGENRGVIGMLDQVPRTAVNQRPLFDEPPLHLFQTRFSRERREGGFRETVVLYRERTHFAEAVRRWMRFCRRRAGIEPMAAPDWAREPVWCSWYSNLYKLNQAEVETQIPHLAKLGFRTVLIDASWFQSKNVDTGCQFESGEYRLNESFFPDFAGMSRRLREAGLRLMLWCAPLFVGARSRIREALAPYCTWDGKTRSSVLCPFCPESRTHASQLMRHLMRDYGLDGVKLDFMDAGFKRDQEQAVCVDPAHDHGDGNDGAAMVDFMQALRDGVLEENPGAAIEYRISYSTLASLPFANCHRGNDAPYDADYMRRENLFLRLFCEYPAAVWSDYAYWHADEKPETISRMLAGQIFSGGVPTVSVDLAGRGAGQRGLIARSLAFYAEHRDALAKSELTVHSADSVFSVSSLQNREAGRAYVLLAGSFIPVRLSLGPGIRDAWILNAGAEVQGVMTLSSGERTVRVKVAGLGPVQARL